MIKSEDGSSGALLPKSVPRTLAVRVELCPYQPWSSSWLTMDSNVSVMIAAAGAFLPMVAMSGAQNTEAVQEAAAIALQALAFNTGNQFEIAN